MKAYLALFRIPELRARLFFTLLVLIIYRVGVHIPVPGVDSAALAELFQNLRGTVFGWLNTFSGGAFEKFSVLALGVMPYISASIILQLMTVSVPFLAELQKEGEQGRKKITQYTRYLTVIIAIFQGFGIATGLEAYNTPSVVLEPGLAFKLITAITLCGGTLFLMWLGEQITERGIGNGISVVIFAGIAASVPAGLGSVVTMLKAGELSGGRFLALAVLVIATFYAIVYVERAVLRVPVNYAKRVVGRSVYGGQTTFLPLRVNTAGVIPPIFASSVIMLPATVAGFLPASIGGKIQSIIEPGSLGYNVLFVILIVFFAYFYTSITFKTEDVAENLKKQGGFVPGIRPGSATAIHLDYLLSRLTSIGAVYMSIISVLPGILNVFLKVPFYFGGTSVMILVGVALDTAAQLETYLLANNYEGFMKHSRVKARGSV